MVVFSELAAYGPSTKRAQRLPGPAEEEFREMAVRHGIWLLPGTLFERDGEHIYNTASVINPSGEVVGRYRKMFPFRPYEQDVTAGEEFLVFDVPDVGRFGVSICYDMWFPETSRTLAAMGTEVLLHPTLTGSIDREVELPIVRATAAQQQCFMFDVNGAGDGGNGRSIIVGPYGDVLYQAGRPEEMIPIEISIWIASAAAARSGCAVSANLSRVTATGTSAFPFTAITPPSGDQTPARGGFRRLDPRPAAPPGLRSWSAGHRKASARRAPETGSC